MRHVAKLRKIPAHTYAAIRFFAFFTNSNMIISLARTRTCSSACTCARSLSLFPSPLSHPLSRSCFLPRTRVHARIDSSLARALARARSRARALSRTHFTPAKRCVCPRPSRAGPDQFTWIRDIYAHKSACMYVCVGNRDDVHTQPALNNV